MGFNQHSITNADGQEDGLSQEQQELVHLFYRFLGESAWGAEPLTVACPACLAGLCFGAWHRAPRRSPYGSSPKVWAISRFWSRRRRRVGLLIGSSGSGGA